MFITDEKQHKNPILANLSCDEKSICIPLPNEICNSALLRFYLTDLTYFLTVSSYRNCYSRVLNRNVLRPECLGVNLNDRKRVISYFCDI